MDENNNPERESDTKEDEAALGEFWRIVAYVLSAIVGLAIVIALLVVASYSLNTRLSDPVQFVTGNLLNALIFAAIVAQVLIYRKQWGAMKDQLEEMRNAVAHSEEAVEIAEANLGIVEKSAITANRAYISVALDRIDGSQFYLRIENSGNTPASNVSSLHSCCLLDEPPVKRKDGGGFFYRGDYTNVQQLSPIAGRSSIIFKPFVFDAPTLTDGNRERIYCWGQICYQDVFYKTRFTWFCFCQSWVQPEGYPHEYGNYGI